VELNYVRKWLDEHRPGRRASGGGTASRGGDGAGTSSGRLGGGSSGGTPSARAGCSSADELTAVHVDDAVEL
jgi:hypothetical protein